MSLFGVSLEGKDVGKVLYAILRPVRFSYELARNWVQTRHKRRVLRDLRTLMEAIRSHPVIGNVVGHADEAVELWLTRKIPAGDARINDLKQGGVRLELRSLALEDTRGAVSKIVRRIRFAPSITRSIEEYPPCGETWAWTLIHQIGQLPETKELLGEEWVEHFQREASPEVRKAVQSLLATIKAELVPRKMKERERLRQEYMLAAVARFGF